MAERTSPPRAVALVVLACGALAASCDGAPGGEVGGDPESAVAPPARVGRFGTLRDFVLFERRLDRGVAKALFVDRFEVTRADWREFAATPEGAAVRAETATLGGDPVWPVGLVSLRQARAFAAWRYARLPQRDEWHAVIGWYYFPWGDKPIATRANTADLGLAAPTPVGAFESGRRSPSVVGQPYDLVGNVSEWTETVPLDWCAEKSDGEVSVPLLPSLDYQSGLEVARRTRAVAVWQVLPGVVPALTAVAPRSDTVPRLVVGADFQSFMWPDDKQPPLPDERVLAGVRRERTGIRLVAAPDELLRALATVDVEPTTADYQRLTRFVRRRGHRAALRRALDGLEPGALGDGPVARWLLQQLRP